MTNFPATVTRLIGRSAAITRLRDLISAYRAVTLTGPGGIGKTTVAMSVAHALLAQFQGAVHFVDLGRLSDPNLVAGTVAFTLGAPVSSGNALPSLTQILRNKRLLLVKAAKNRPILGDD